MVKLARLALEWTPPPIWSCGAGRNDFDRSEAEIGIRGRLCTAQSRFPTAGSYYLERRLAQGPDRLVEAAQAAARGRCAYGLFGSLRRWIRIRTSTVVFSGLPTARL